MAVQIAFSVREAEPAALLADASRSVLAGVAHVQVHVLEVEHLTAALVAAARRGEVTRLRVLGKLLKFDDLPAAPCVMLAADVQFEHEALEWRHVVQLLGRHASPALRRTAALLRHPRQHTRRAEDVAARRRERLLQHFVAEVALQVRVHGAAEALQLEAHGLVSNAKKKLRKEKRHGISAELRTHTLRGVAPLDCELLLPEQTNCLKVCEEGAVWNNALP